MDARAELESLRRLDELERKAGSSALSSIGAPPKASLADKMAGGWGGRMLQGMASPVLAGVQMLGGEKGREMVAELDAMKNRGMAADGKDGFDWYGLMGSMVPGSAIAKGIGAALPASKLLQGGAIGAATAAAQPVTPSPDFWSDKASQVGTGAAIGGAAGLVGQALASIPGKAKINPTASQTLQDGQQAGYVVPPSAVNPSFVNSRLESIAGKAAVGQEAAKRNQEITNALVVKELGLPKGTSLTESSLKAVRKEAGKTYEEVSKLEPPASMEWFPRFHDKDLLEQLKKARADASLAYKSNTVTPHPDMLAKAEALSAKADSIDTDLAAIAKANGREDLVKALAKARTMFAKSYDVERALNLGDENISAPILGRQLDKAGTAAKSGSLATIGKMAEAFPSVMREGGRVPSPGVSGTDAASSAILGTLGYGAGGPAGILAAGLPLMRGPARNIVLSPGYQQLMTNHGTASRYQQIIESLMQQGAGAAGTGVARQF